MADLKAFGDRLRQLRNSEKITQQDLADKLDIARASVGYYESGTRAPDIEVLRKIAEHFAVTSDYLLGLSAHKNNDAQAEALSRLQQLEPRIRSMIQELENKLANCYTSYFLNSDGYPYQRWFYEYLDFLKATMEIFDNIAAHEMENRDVLQHTDTIENLLFELKNCADKLALSIYRGYISRKEEQRFLYTYKKELEDTEKYEAN